MDKINNIVDKDYADQMLLQNPDGNAREGNTPTTHPNRKQKSPGLQSTTEMLEQPSKQVVKPHIFFAKPRVGRI
jgi:hypothetical protein